VWARRPQASGLSQGAPAPALPGKNRHGPAVPAGRSGSQSTSASPSLLLSALAALSLKKRQTVWLRPLAKKKPRSENNEIHSQGIILSQLLSLSLKKFCERHNYCHLCQSIISPVKTRCIRPHLYGKTQQNKRGFMYACIYIHTNMEPLVFAVAGKGLCEQRRPLCSEPRGAVRVPGRSGPGSDAVGEGPGAGPRRGAAGVGRAGERCAHPPGTCAHRPPRRRLPRDFCRKTQSFCHLSRLTFSDLLIQTVKNR